MVSLLLALTTDVDVLHADKSAMSALMAAASNGSTSIVDRVLEVRLCSWGDGWAAARPEA